MRIDAGFVRHGRSIVLPVVIALAALLGGCGFDQVFCGSGAGRCETTVELAGADWGAQRERG